jgi:hypothetical protein
MQALKAHLQANASPTFSLPPPLATLPSIRWSGPVTPLVPPDTTLSNGVIIPVTHPSIGGPIRNRLAALAGNPTLNGYPCLAVSRPFTCRGAPRTTSSRSAMRIKTNARVIEFTGVVPDNGGAIPVMIVDGKLVPPTALAASRGAPGGYSAGTIVVDFGTSAMRDIWVETLMLLAHIKIDSGDMLLPAGDQSEPQMTVAGDSYLQAHSGTFPSDGGIALEIGARLGIRKIAVDAVGGTGYYNTGGNNGNLNDRLPAHAADDSLIYLVMAGLNDYGDVNGWPTRAQYESSVYDYVKNLRAAQPKALIVVTAPFCPTPPLSDSLLVANAATNTSGLGDYMYTAQLHKDAVQQIAGPWIYIDVLLGGGWLNSSGAKGDITGLQWFTGGNAPLGVSIGGGGGFGGIRQIPIMSGGKYSQGPQITASGGTGQGLLISGVIDGNGALTSIPIYASGQGYTPGAGLPTFTIDRTYEITAATLGTPQLTQGYNADPATAAYPLPSSAPLGGDLNNIYRLLWEDRTHPSVLGVEYLARRLAENIYQAVMAL